MLTPFPMDFLQTPEHAAIIDETMTSLSLAGVYCARPLLGRRVCKRVDVYIITLSCSWRIYALSERLLVLFATTCGNKMHSEFRSTSRMWPRLYLFHTKLNSDDSHLNRRPQ